ncbi:MAG: SDR family oxidoreductase [Candidatus Schekmanbacteria bacterium]|nr:MAG: SDR family oxidoreductase [Candidatus Schekmanbacteria bacterium]
MKEISLKGKKAVITGGAKNMGRIIALELARLGVDIAVGYYKSFREAEMTVKEIQAFGVKALSVKADIRKSSEAEGFVESAVRGLGGIDYLINNAGYFQSADIDKVDRKMWFDALTTNLTGPFFCAQKAAEYMKRQGSGKIVNISSLGGIRPWPKSIPYCASKAGLIMLTQCLAVALAPEIQVNAIAPGMITLPDSYSDEIRERIVKRIPLKKTGKFEDIAKAVVFLLSESNFTTGEVLTIDGGQKLR